MNLIVFFILISCNNFKGLVNFSSHLHVTTQLLHIPFLCQKQLVAFNTACTFALIQSGQEAPPYGIPQNCLEALLKLKFHVFCVSDALAWNKMSINCKYWKHSLETFYHICHCRYCWNWPKFSLRSRAHCPALCDASWNLPSPLWDVNDAQCSWWTRCQRSAFIS